MGTGQSHNSGSSPVGPLKVPDQAAARDLPPSPARADMISTGQGGGEAAQAACALTAHLLHSWQMTAQHACELCLQKQVHRLQSSCSCLHRQLFVHS